MNAVNHRQTRFFDVRCHGFIRRQHELLDQTMRIVASRAPDANHRAELIELQQRFRQIEIDRSPSHPFLVKDQRQLLHQLESFDQRRIPAPQIRVTFEYSMHRRIGHSLGTADDAARKILRDHVAALVDL